jgi:phosphoglycolate phosphatase-like HAD superfamily hydrolase
MTEEMTDRPLKRNGDAKNELSDSPVTASAVTHYPTSSVSDLRILLWDIDGTLIHSVRTGAYKVYMIPALENVFGTSGRLEQMRVSGMTDLQIVGEALRDEGFTQNDIRDRLDHLRDQFMEEMEKATGTGERFFQVLPGVPEALRAIADHPRYHSAMLTGNLEPAAYLKMKLVALADFFTLPGAFGDESHDRSDLPAIAAERISRHLQLDLEPHQFIIIGDTPNDIACAQHFGARALAVGTGRLYTMEEMLACKPDAWLADLSDIDLFVQTLDKL